MNKKFISMILASLMVASVAAIPAAAADAEVEKSGEGNTIKFNVGDAWPKDDTILLYMWAEKEGESNMGCTKGVWGGEPNWGTKKNKMSPVEGEEGVFESYEFEWPGDDWNVFVIFHDLTTGDQSCNCVLTQNGYGSTAYFTGDFFENSVDSEKRDRDVAFEGADDCGAHKKITSTGNIVGSVKAPNDDGAYIVAQYVYDKVGTKDKNGEECVTDEKVATAISEFETTADDTWAKFQSFKDNPDKYPDYASKEADAKKFIKPTEEEKTESKTESSTDSKTESSTESKTESEKNNSSSGSKTTTTTTNTTKTNTTGATSAAAGTASAEAGAETGDTTHTAAFAAVFAAAAAAMFLTRKKVED